MDNNLFSERLKEARLNAKLKQTELAKMSGVTAATISAYERADEGKGKNPSLENAIKLAQALNVSLDWLCGLAVSNEKVQISDFLKMLVKLDKGGIPLALDNVDLWQDDYKKLLPRAAGIYSENDFFEMASICDDLHQPRSFPNVTLTFNYTIIRDFLSEWTKLRDLYNGGTIDEELYDLWLNQQYKKADDRQKDIDSFKGFIITSEEGDPNGNNPIEE